MRHNPDSCHVCSLIKEFPDETHVELARRAGTSEASVRRHRTPMHDPLAAKDDFFTAVPEAIITSRGRSIRTADGSWEKITYRPQDLARHEAATYDDLEHAIAAYQPQRPTSTTHLSPHTEVLCLADFQIGKVASGGGTAELVARVLGAVDAFVAQSTRPAEVVLFELGDVLENFDNVGSQRATNDLDLTLQLRTARRLLLEVLLRVAHLAPKVTLVSVPSNHCQVRAFGKDLASTPNNDWGIELSHQLEDVMAGRPEFGHIRFVRTEGHDEAVTYTCGDGTVVGAVHGHQAGKQTSMGDWWRGQSHGRRTNLHNADILLFGHFHNLSVGQSGDARWLIGTSAADGGSDWFTNKTGESAKAGLTTFTVRNGMWSNLRIL